MMSPLLTGCLSFTIVMLSMALLTGLLYATRYVSSRLEAREARPASERIDDETMAMLVAAAHAALGSAVRIHRVHLHHDQRQDRWSRAGRMDIMLSHRVGPRR